MLRAIEPYDKEILDVMRYAYGAIAFVGVVTLVFVCLVALQRVLG